MARLSSGGGGFQARDDLPLTPARFRDRLSITLEINAPPIRQSQIDGAIDHLARWLEQSALLDIPDVRQRLSNPRLAGDVRLVAIYAATAPDELGELLETIELPHESDWTRNDLPPPAPPPRHRPGTRDVNYLTPPSGFTLAEWIAVGEQQAFLKRLDPGPSRTDDDHLLVYLAALLLRGHLCIFALQFSGRCSFMLKDLFRELVAGTTTSTTDATEGHRIEDELIAALAKDGGTSSAWLETGRLYLSKRRPGWAIICLNQAIARDETNGEAWHLKGVAQSADGLDQASTASFAKAEEFGYTG